MATLLPSGEEVEMKWYYKIFDLIFSLIGIAAVVVLIEKNFFFNPPFVIGAIILLVTFLFFLFLGWKLDEWAAVNVWGYRCPKGLHHNWAKIYDAPSTSMVKDMKLDSGKPVYECSKCKTATQFPC